MPFSDAQIAERMAEWPKYYLNREVQLGATATMVNFGDPNSGKLNATTFTGRKFNASGLSPVWTPSSALSGWATPFDLRGPANWQGVAPVLTFNGTSEEADTPDADYWTRVETAAFSIGAWVWPTDITNVVLLSKWDETTGAQLREWLFWIDGNSKLKLNIYDESANIDVNRPSSTTIVANQWQFVVVTYTGDGGADAADSINLYINGTVGNGTASNNASYVAMENLSTVTRLGFNKGAAANANFFAGKMLGGSFCPFFVQAELTLEQVKNMYEFERKGLGV